MSLLRIKLAIAELQDVQCAPCPFCGYDKLGFYEGSTYRWMGFGCGRCGIGSEERLAIGAESLADPERIVREAAERALTTWNTRPAQTGS